MSETPERALPGKISFRVRLSVLTRHSGMVYSLLIDPFFPQLLPLTAEVGLHFLPSLSDLGCFILSSLLINSEKHRGEKITPSDHVAPKNNNCLVNSNKFVVLSQSE